MLKKVIHKHTIIAQQGTSPYYSNESFTLIGETLAQSSFKALAYVDYIPSFGLWGFWLASLENNNIVIKQEDLFRFNQNLLIPTQYLSKEQIDKSFYIGQSYINRSNHQINTIKNNLIFFHYLTSWKNQIYL